MNSQGDFFWLASFPRSGNTFIRNILFDVFGLESGTYDLKEDGSLLEPACLSFPVVKTHMLPSGLKPDTPETKAVYIVRDGRDAMVSIAHHRSNIIAPGSDFLNNMRAAIYAEKGTFFGGWSANVDQWLERADLLIRYEDLIADTIACVEKLRTLLGLPDGDYTKIPGFEKLKFGKPRYGSGFGHDMTEEQRKNLALLNFRKGKSGSWMEEMPDDLHDLFWSIHGDTMVKLGYNYENCEIAKPNPDIDWKIISLSAVPDNQPPPFQQKKINILVEADKILSPVNDGVKRYQKMLLKEFIQIDRNPLSRWKFNLFLNNRILSVDEATELISTGFYSPPNDQPAPAGMSLSFKLPRVQEKMLSLVPQSLKNLLVRKRIMIFHRIYDFTWEMIHGTIHLLKKTGSGAGRFFRMLTSLLLKHKESVIDESIITFDLVHLPLQHHYTGFKKTRKPIVVTVHDFTHRIFPRFHTPVNTRNAEKGWRFAVKRATRLIAVSESTASDARKYSRGIVPPLDVIPEAIDRSRFHHIVNSDERRAVCEKYGIPGDIPFFLTLSSIEPRKNLENIISAFFKMLSADTDAKVMLVISGKKSWGAFHPHTFAGFDPSKVVFTGFVDDVDLPMLYSEALAFCYVSHYEGFGLPLLEAMNCGTPVIYGNNSSMPEITGDAGLPADAADIKSIAQQMQKLFYDENLRNRLSGYSLRQAARFNSRYMAEATLETYLRALKN